MKSKQKKRLQAHRRIYGWLGEQPALLAHAMISQFFAALGTVLASLAAAVANQESHFRAAKGVTAETKRIRRELVGDFMRLIARVARATIPDVVQVTTALQMPPHGIDAEGLLVAAEALANSAEQHQDVLAREGLAPDAIVQLRTVARQFREAIDARGQLVAQRRGATTEIDVQLDRARKLVDTLSVLIARELRNDRATLAEWEQLKRVVKSGSSTASGESADLPDASTTPVGNVPSTPVAASTIESPATPEQRKAA